jgi:tetratricopeptide (TPR) repeat protein
VALLLLVAGLALGGLALPGAAAAGDKGGRAYGKGDYDAARDAYEAYAREHPTDPRGTYNLGTALHRTGELSPSEEALLRAAGSGDPKLRAAAFYNLGNTRVKAGDLKGALEAYEMSLRARPSDRDAKHNLELVRALLQQQPPDSSDQEQNQQNQKDQTQQDQQKDQKQQGQQNQQDQQTPQDPQKQQEQAKSQDPNATPPPDGSQGEPPQPTEPLKISPEQARSILEGLAQQEMQLQQERLRARSRKLHVEKDW